MKQSRIKVMTHSQLIICDELALVFSSGSLLLASQSQLSCGVARGIAGKAPG
jgi:hypothetical protein